MAFWGQASALFGTVILPVLLIVAGGAMVQRFHRMEMQTLSKMQIYLFVPVFLFYYTYTSKLSLRDMGGIAVVAVVSQLILALPLWFALKRLKVRQGTLSVALLSAVIYNAGNFGIPVALRAFGPPGASVQAVVVMMANLALWGVGYAVMATTAGRGLKGAIIGYLKLPMVYLLVLAFILRGLSIALPEPILYSLKLVADGLVPLALMTLGAQLALQARWPRWKAVLPVAAFKLLLLPAVTAGVVVALGMWPWPGAALVVSAAGPTAVNTLLLTIEQKGDVELAAECVFWTTVLAALTVTVVLAVVKLAGGAPPVGH